MKDDNFATVAQLNELDGFKLAIAGSRHIDVKIAERIIRDQWKPLRKHFGKKPVAIITGDANGVDRAAANLAMKLTGRPAFRFLADWVAYGKAAGPIRNVLVAQECHALLLIWDGKSKGSRDVRQKTQSRGKPVYEVEVEIPKTRR